MTDAGAAVRGAPPRADGSLRSSARAAERSRASPQASMQASSELGASHGGMMRALTMLQLGLLAWVGVQLCDRTARGRRLLRATGALLAPWSAAPHRGRTPTRGRVAAQPMDSRLLGELT